MQASSETHKPKVSVVSIALIAEEFKPLIEGLKLQTFQDYEFVGEAGGSIPEAWNRAIHRSQGEIVVLTETDARPVDDRWLEEMVTGVTDQGVIVKGLEITRRQLDLSNMAVHRSVFEKHRFNEQFKGVEDIDLLSRLKEEGYVFKLIDQATVIHLSKLKSRHYIRRAFRYGLYWAKLRRRYADPVYLANVPQAGKVFLSALLNLLGLLIGYVIYFPESRYRNKNDQTS